MVISPRDRLCRQSQPNMRPSGQGTRKMNGRDRTRGSESRSRVVRVERFFVQSYAVDGWTHDRKALKALRTASTTH